VHISFADLVEMDRDSALQDKWIADYRARWAARRAAASVATGDGGAWLEGDAARAIACDAMAVPVVLGDIDAGAVEDLIGLCARYHQIRTSAPDQIRTSAPDQISSGAPDPAGWPGRAGGQDATGRGAQNPAATPDSGGNTVLPDGLTGRAARHAEQATMVAEALAEMERQILAKVLQVVSGPGGVASFLRRNLLGKGLNGPSLPLDVGQTDDIPVHLRRLVALRDRGLPVPRRLRPARGRLRGPPRDPPGRRRPDQPGQPQGLLLVAPPRRAAPARLDPDHPPRRHQPRPKPRRQDHPQPQPPTQARVT